MTSAVGALLVLCLAVPAGADIYRQGAGDGPPVFTDAPTDPSYRVVIRTAPPRLPWRQTAERVSRHAGLDPDLVRAVIYVESGENPRAVSPAGARGLMQLMPQTAAELGVQDSLRPRDNLRGGVKYLSDLLDRYDGRIEWALAAYNAGPCAVDRYGGVPPYRETRAYVRRVLDVYARIGKNRALQPAATLDTPGPSLHNPALKTERE